MSILSNLTRTLRVTVLNPPSYLYAGLCLGVLSFSTTSHAQLPNDIQQALAQAHIHADDMSLVILPLHNTVSPQQGAATTQQSAVIHPTAVANPTSPTNYQTNYQSHLPATLYPATALTNGSNDLAINPATSASPSIASTDAATPSQASDDLSAAASTQMAARSSPISAHSSTDASHTPAVTAATAMHNPAAALPALTHSIEHLANVRRTPASTMKLIPTFIALDQLGSDFGWHTRVYYTGFMVNKHLYGDLIIEGSGDPKLTDERLQQLLTQVKQAGIEHIEGNIILDSSIFQQVSKDPAAFDNDPLRPYNASPDGLLVNFSSVKIQSYPKTTELAQMLYSPRLADYRLPDSIAIQSGACAHAHYSLAPKWEKDQLSFASALPSGCGEHAFYIAFPNAKEFAARVVKQLWTQLGNSLSGEVIAQEQPTAYQPRSPLPVVSYPSLPLSNIIHDINHHSNNVMTEQLTLSLPVYSKATDRDISSLTFPAVKRAIGLYQQRPSSNYPKALNNIEQWWRSHLTTPVPLLTNGSGLCRDCAVTAANLAELLSYAYQHPEFASYVDSLGVAGVSGTIADHQTRLPESQAIGRAWIKTGTLNNVTAMAGYVKGLSEQDYVVVAIINSEQALNTFSARKVLDQMLDWTAKH